MSERSTATAQEWVIWPRRAEIEKFREWAEANLRAGDAVVIESATKMEGDSHEPR